MTNHAYSLHITAEISQLERVRQFVEEKACAFGVTPPAVYDILLAVNELVTNIVVHGYRGQPGVIDIEMRQEEDAVVVCLVDNAAPFDPTLVPPLDPRVPLHQRPPGGMGIPMARRFMDDITHRVPAWGGNELVLIKKGVVTGRSDESMHTPSF